MKKRIPAEVVASVLASTTVILSLPPFNLPPWAIFISWAGTFAARRAQQGNLSKNLAGDAAGIVCRDDHCSALWVDRSVFSGTLGHPQPDDHHIRSQCVHDAAGQDAIVSICAGHVFWLRQFLCNVLWGLGTGGA